jgi:hypothetical protein
MRERLDQIRRLIHKWEVWNGWPHEDLPTLVRLKMIGGDNPYLALYARRNLRVRPSYIAACVITIWIVGLITWLVTRGK